MKRHINELLKAKPVLPGTLEKRYNICGKAGCRCKDKKNPRKHGPYYRLSYSVMGKNSSVFVKERDAKVVKQLTENYKHARSTIQELSLELIESYCQNGLEVTLEKYNKLVEKEQRRIIGKKPESAILRNMRSSRDKWKKKAMLRQAALEKNRIKIRDLIKSRDKWKKKAMKARREVAEVKKKFSNAEKEIEKLKQEVGKKKKFKERRKTNGK